MIKVIITSENIERNQKSLESQINGYTHKIRDKLTQYGEIFSDSTFQGSIDAVYQGFSIVDLLWNYLVKGKRLQKDAGMILSAYVGADCGLECLNIRRDGKVMASQRNIFNGEKIDFTKTYPHPLDDLLRIYSNGLDQHGRMGLAALTGQYFSWLRDKTLLESEFYKQYESQLNNVAGKIGENYSFQGLSGKVKRFQDKPNEFTWKNFGGYHDVVNYFKDQILIIQNLDYCLSLGTLKMKQLLPKGTLLIGPPGTGKTTLARTFCNEAGILFDMFGVSEVGTSLVYETANNIQRKFDEAARTIKGGDTKVSLLFIDELDSLGKRRSGHSNGSNEEDKVVTTINYNMDGHLAVDGVIALGATNRPDILDPALIRPGRFSEWKYMGEPAKDELKEIFLIYANSNSGVLNVDIDNIINKYVKDSQRKGFKRTDELIWTGAVVHEVVVRAKRRKLIEHLRGGGSYQITTEDVCSEIERYKTGN